MEPYKSQILPQWRFKTPELARVSAGKILSLFYKYAAEEDFVGMDMARKFLQMGFTRSKRYANHASGRKYETPGGPERPREMNLEKAESAAIFYEAWQQAEGLTLYHDLKIGWKILFG